MTEIEQGQLGIEGDKPEGTPPDPATTITEGAGDPPITLDDTGGDGPKTIEEYEAEVKAIHEKLSTSEKEVNTQREALERERKEQQADYTRKTQYLQTLADTKGVGDEFRSGKEAARVAKEKGTELPLTWKTHDFFKGDTKEARQSNAVANAIAAQITERLAGPVGEQVARVSQVESTQQDILRHTQLTTRWAGVEKGAIDELKLTPDEIGDIQKEIMASGAYEQAQHLEGDALSRLYRVYALGVRSLKKPLIQLPTKPGAAKPGSNPDTLGASGRASGKEAQAAKTDRDHLLSVISPASKK